MTAAAIALVLAAAVLHATWNLLIKRAGGGSAFIWLALSLSAILYAPVASNLTERCRNIENCTRRSGIFLAGPEGIEPPTRGLGVPCSIH